MLPSTSWHARIPPRSPLKSSVISWELGPMCSMNATSLVPELHKCHEFLIITDFDPSLCGRNLSRQFANLDCPMLCSSPSLMCCLCNHIVPGYRIASRGYRTCFNTQMTWLPLNMVTKAVLSMHGIPCVLYSIYSHSTSLRSIH